MADQKVLTSDITTLTPPVTTQPTAVTAAPALPAPAEPTEYYAGFTEEFKGLGVELQGIYKQLQQAEKKLAEPIPLQLMSEGILKSISATNPFTYIQAALINLFASKEAKQAATQAAQAEFDALAKQFQLAEWKMEIMQVLPIYLADPTYKIEKPEDILQYVAPGVDLTDADTAWLKGTFDKLSPLMNTLPEGYTGDVLDAQSQILNNILTAPKLEMKGVHHLTVDEIAKSFAFGVAELPAGMSEEDVRSMLSKMDLNDEELKSQQEWLAERAKEWEIESARMSLIRAGEILADVPELTPLQWAKMIVTQPMMATMELMQKWWDTISRPISAALMMNLPAPVAGAAHGVALGAVVGGTIGSIVPLIGTAVGAGIGALIGAIGGAGLFAAFETDADKELTKLYDSYRSQGENAWSSYAQAFNAWEAPWWKKMILDSAYDPLQWIGWGAVSAVGTKLTKMALPRGLKTVGTRIGSLMVAFENGYTTGMDAIFKAGVQVVAAPIKSVFWLTGAGYTIPKTFMQMSRNFGRSGMMDLLAVTQQRFPAAKLVRGKLVGITTKDFTDVLADCTRYALKNPTINDTMAKAGTAVMEFAYLDDVAVAKFLKGLVDVSPAEEAAAKVTGEAVAGAPSAVKGLAMEELEILAKKRGLVSLQEYGSATIAKRNQLVARYLQLEEELVAARVAENWDLVLKIKNEMDQLYKFTTLLGTRNEYRAYIETGRILPEFEGLVAKVEGLVVPTVAPIGGLILDTSQLAKFNSDLLDAFSGFVDIPGVAVIHGDRIAAGNILNRFNKLANLGSDEATKLVDDLASRIGKFKENVAKKVVDSVKDMAPGDAIYSVFDGMVNNRYSNLRSPLTQYMQQAGRSASWHSRVADRILYSARLVAMERRLVMPIAKQQLLFTNFGPYNYLENSMRSFLGGAEFSVPKAYSGIDETLEVIGKLSGCPYEMVMMQRGERKLVQAMVDPETGRALIFKGGSIPLVTRNVVIPEKIPYFGGKELGMTLSIGGKKYFLGSAQDWYDMWADMVSKQLAYDYQVHFTKAIYETSLGKKTIDDVNSILSNARPILNDIPSVKQYVSDTERLLRWKALDGPGAIREMANVDVLTFNRRWLGQQFNQAADQMYDVHRIVKESLYDNVLDGSMFSKGYSSIDDRFAAALAAERDLSIASLSPQIEALKDQVDWLLANPAKNLDDFMWDVNHLTTDIEAVRATIHDYRRLTRVRSGQMILSEADDFEVGSAKQLAKYMDESEESLVKYMNQLMENAKVAGLSDIQLARLSDLDSLSRLELNNVLAARTRLAEIEAEIPAFHKRIKGLWKTNPDRAAKESGLFWNEGTNSQRFRKAAVWEEFDEVADKLKYGRLEASRNFLMSVDKPAFMPDFVPEVVGELTANHLAYLYGATGDDLYRGLTRISHNTMTMPRKDFIIHTREQASAYAAKFGKTADQIGFTEEAIGEVYDQMWRSLGVNPNILTPDSPTALQLEELRQEMYRWYGSTKIPESDVIKWRQYINSVADEVGNLDAYKAVAGVTPTVMETGQPYTAKLYRGTKLKGQPPTDEGLVGKGQYWTTSEAVAKTYDAVKEASISLKKPLVIKTQTEWDDFTNMRIRPIRDTAAAEGRSEDWVQTMLRSQLENEGYDGVIIGAGIVEKGTQVAVFYPEKAVGAAPPITKLIELTKGDIDAINDALVYLQTLSRGEVISDAKLDFLTSILEDVGIESDTIMKLASLSDKVDISKLLALRLNEVKNIINKTGKFTKSLATVTKAPVPPKAVVPTVSGTPEWWATKESAMTKAREMHAMAYPTYDDANIIDETMRAIFPFWNYELFRWKWLPRTFMRTPGVMSGLARYMNYTDSGYMPVPGTDLQINILRGTIFMGGLRSFYLKDFPEYHDAVPGIEFLDYIGRAGFFPGIHVMLPISLFGAPGKQPQLGQLAPAWVKTSLSALRALSPQHIGAILDVVYPDRFRDYLTMMELASMGYDADEIWKKKQQGTKLTDEEEKLWLQAVNKVDGVKGILMNQTGLFRIRPQEFTQLRQQMRLAIEEATGVPVKTQEWIDKMYPVTGKRFTDYFHLDIQQQALLYQWESYRRYQGITTPLYPSSWQALDIKISDYYQELEKVYNDARYNGVYENGELVQPSIADINHQLIEGTIGPSQWRSLRDDILGGLSEAVRVLGESPAYKDVPKTFDERATLLAERGVVTPTQTPDQELLYYYYELKPELKYNWESGRMELDYDTYYAYIDALLDSLSAPFRERLLARIQNDWTPMEKLYWEFSRTYARPYRNIRDIVLREYTPEQVKMIRRFEVARGDERDALLEVMGPEGKLISGYQSKLREARLRLRILDPELDAWLYFFGTTDKFMSAESKEIYNNLAKQYLVPSMVGEAK